MQLNSSWFDSENESERIEKASVEKVVRSKYVRYFPSVDVFGEVPTA